MTVLLLIAGFAVFSMASAIGSNLAGSINQWLGNFLGINPGTGESAEVPGV